MKHFIYFLALAIVFASCGSTAKLVDKGEYDEAISLAVKRLQGKKNKKTKYVEHLEKAFANATEKDLNEIAFMKDQNKPENWDKVYRILLNMENRQKKIKPLLPLVSEDDYQANFKFVRVEPMLIEAEQGSADYHYSEGKRLLSKAENGDKIAAQRAYEEFRRIDKLFKHFKDKDRLREKALRLGTVNILIDVKNKSDAILPKDFEDELTRIDVRKLENMWTRYYTKDPGGLDFDFMAAIVLDRLFISPEKEKEVFYIDEKEVKDGFEYVLDDHGNVMKDTLGNDIKVDKYTNIRAEINELFRYKAVTISGKVIYKDLRTSEVIKSRPINVEAVFENYASRFKGDERALSSKTKGRLLDRPLPFPSDYDLTMQAADQLKSILLRELKYDMD